MLVRKELQVSTLRGNLVEVVIQKLCTTRVRLHAAILCFRWTLLAYLLGKPCLLR